MKQQKLNHHYAINADSDLLTQIPVAMLAKIVTMMKLLDMAGFTVVNTYFNNLLPKTYKVYPYVDSWCNTLVTESVIDEEKELRIVHESKECSYSIDAEVASVELLEQNDTAAMEHLLAIGALCPKRDIDVTDKLFLIQSPEMLKTVWSTKQAFQEQHTIPTFAQVFELVMLCGNKDHVDRLLTLENGAWGTTPKDMWNETIKIAVNSTFNHATHPTPIQTILLFTKQEQMVCPLWSYAFTKQSMLEMEHINEVMIKTTWMDMHPIHCIVSDITNETEAEVVAVLTRILPHLPIFVLNSYSTEHQNRSVLEILFAQRPLKRAILQVFNECVPFKRDNKQFY